jgi:hypothetical protein
MHDIKLPSLLPTFSRIIRDNFDFIETDLNGISIGTTKVYPVGEVNDRIICILKEDAHTRKDF